ncbi:MAG TPA: hypothetical protein VJ859_02165 [Allosphingosinicella sp.]|nr:hypothetical protein [Allosphingosinicella sp.]
MFRSRLPAVLIVLLASACGDTSPPPPPKYTAAKDNPAHQRMLAARDVDRMLALRRAIQDDDGSCPKVTGSSFQENYKGMAMWVAYCSNGPWAVYIAPSGDIQARPCKDSRTLKLPECLPARPDSSSATPWPANSLPMPPAGTH